MKRLLSILVLSICFASVSAQKAEILPTVTKLKTYTGRATQVIVTDVNTGGLFATDAIINAETADEFDIYAGAGGRKWKRVSKIGPPDTLYTVRPIFVRPRGVGRRIDTFDIKLDTNVYYPVPLAAYFNAGTNVTFSGLGTPASPLTINSSGGGGSGTVTSVALSVPSGFSVSGTPVTTSGTLAISTTLNGLLTGTGSGFSAVTTSSGISGILSDETGSGAAVFATSPVLTTPQAAQINGGTAAGSGIVLRATTGNANTSSFIDFQTGNNGATRALRINNAGTVHVGAGSPAANDIFYVGKTTGYDPIGAFETTVSDGMAMFGLISPSSIWNFGTAAPSQSYQNLGGKFFVYDKTNELAALVIDRTGLRTGIAGITQPTAFLHTPASNTSYASFRMPHGVRPTTPNNGDMWTTTVGAYARISSVDRPLANPHDSTFLSTVSTSNATPTTLETFTIPSNTVGWIRVEMTANGILTGNTHNLKGIKYYSYEKQGGTLTIDAADVIVADKKGASVSGASWQVTSSSNNPVVQVTGVSSVTMQWKASIQVIINTVFP